MRAESYLSCHALERGEPELAVETEIRCDRSAERNASRTASWLRRNNEVKGLWLELKTGACPILAFLWLGWDSTNASAGETLLRRLFFQFLDLLKVTAAVLRDTSEQLFECELP